MYISTENYRQICEEVRRWNAQLVAVSKTKPVEAIQELYALGHRDFGENYVQEASEKQVRLPQDIRWHFIGHLQTNKVKYIAPFVHLVHGIDSLRLLKEVNKQGQKLNRTIPVLLQVHIAREETKFGFDQKELEELLCNEEELQQLENIQINGLMGMASFLDDTALVRQEFKNLKAIFDRCRQQSIAHADFQILSMGMSGDYHIALEEGSTMVRIGSLLFGNR